MTAQILVPSLANKPPDATAAPSTLTLAVDNMHCGGCMRSVERAALAVRGVETARASLAAKRLSVTYDAALASYLA